MSRGSQLRTSGRIVADQLSLPAPVALPWLAALILLATMPADVARAELPPRAPVPPSMEIEVLDPNVDPNGNPAVILKDGRAGDCLVDIPPVVLVHRYYYSGNRSFQGPMLPGGPTIAVVNHPKTGVRCYVPLQMMPGAPIVRYRAKSIEYDFGEHGTTIQFETLTGMPTVKYRNHTRITRKVNDAIDASTLPQTTEKVKEAGSAVRQRAGVTVKNTVVVVEKTVKTVLTPVVQLAQLMPMAKWVLQPNPEHASGAYAEQYQRDKEVQRASNEQTKADTSLPSNQ